MSEPLIRVRGVTKDFRGLRPLRLQEFDLHEGDAVALLGLDQAMGEVLVNLLTGATLPDTGEIHVFGELTASITDPQAWVRTLDQFGLISERAVLLDELTAEQNLAMPFSLRLHTMPAEVRAQVRALADEVGLAAAALASPVAALPPLDRQRVRLGRALALNPKVLLAEHPNAPLSEPDTPAFAADLTRIVSARRLSALVVTANREFATAIGQRVLALQPATGVLRPATGWRRWLS